MSWIRPSAFFQVEVVNRFTWYVVVIYRFEGKVVVDLFYLGHLSNNGGVTVVWMGSAMERDEEHRPDPHSLNVVASLDRALEWLRYNYASPRLAKQ